MIKDITGQKFGKLTAVKYLYKTKDSSNSPIWEFECECGTKIDKNRKLVEKGKVKSCGNRECFNKQSKSKHSKSKHSLYTTWLGMKDRCYNVNQPGYANYGGRGIVVCDRWLESFENFLEDVGEKPSSKHSIDRKDNDGNYEPSNVKWSTSQEQQRNRRNTIFIEREGEIKTLIEWCELLDANYDVCRNRLKRGWPLEDLFQPTLEKEPVEYDGQIYNSLRGLSAHYKIRYESLLSRLSRGWTLQEAIDTSIAKKYSGQRLITYLDTTLNISQWSNQLGISKETIKRRLEKGLPIEEVLAPPQQYKYGEYTLALKDWASKLSIKLNTLESRLRSGWTIEKTLNTPSRKYSIKNR
jgi:hypothetical protein